MNRALHMALGMLVLACFVTLGLIARESAHLATTSNRLRATNEPFTTTEEEEGPSVDEQMAIVPITQVPGSELETYTFPDIEAAFGALQDRVATMEENAKKFIEARDIMNVVHKDSARFDA